MARLFIAILLSASVTLGLLFLMQALIKSGDGELSEPPRGSVLDFVRVKQDEVVEKKDRKPKKPPKPEEAPPQLEQPQMESSTPDAEGSGFNFSADVGSDMALEGGISLESSDGDYVPLLNVAAVYPRRAMSRGIEGYAIVKFVVTKSGSVRDPVVVEAEPQDVFNKSALDAALKLKYKPRVINGEAAEVAGVQKRFTFKLDG